MLVVLSPLARQVIPESTIGDLFIAWPMVLDQHSIQDTRLKKVQLIELTFMLFLIYNLHRVLDNTL